MSAFSVADLGEMDYLECVECQKAMLEDVLANRIPDTLILVEHPPVITLGANFHSENLIYSRAWYGEHGIALEAADRGGDVTYHGPGQLVAYPIFNLEHFGKDLHKWLRKLEEVVILTLAELEIQASRFPPNTGVWVEDRKICAMGVKVRRWVSMHGLALNCDLALNPFKAIVPCGIRDYGVTSISEVLGRKVSVEETKPRLISAFKAVFG